MSPVNNTGVLGIDRVKACAFILTWIRHNRAKRRKKREIHEADEVQEVKEGLYCARKLKKKQ
jgi:hypothetical protein